MRWFITRDHLIQIVYKVMYIYSVVPERQFKVMITKYTTVEDNIKFFVCLFVYELSFCVFYYFLIEHLQSLQMV